MRRMRRLGCREFKNRVRKYLRAVRGGQSLLITDRGKLVAKVSPPEETSRQFLRTR
jgi:prevent-host-death family protein